MASEHPKSDRKIVLIGNPNVGKSVIFRLLTGSYVMVSNFPGTTVEISRGRMQLGGLTYEVVDTPGVYSCVPQSEDERVTCDILLQEAPDLIIQVADAKNLRRTLLITSQLVEFGIPTIVVLNMMDEAEERGIQIDTRRLSELFSLPVIETVAIYSRGRKKLLQAIQEARRPGNPLQTEGWFEAGTLSADNVRTVPAALAVEWLALEDRNFTRQVENTLGERVVREMKQIAAIYRETHRRSLAREVEEARSAFLDDAVTRLKTKREAAYVDPTSASASRLWLACLIAGIVLFAWNEVGNAVGFRTPYSHAVSMTVAATATVLDALPAALGSGVVREIVLGAQNPGEDSYGLVPELVHLLFLLAPVVIPFAVLLRTNPGFVREFGILTRRPLTGIPILVLILLLVYEFVGYTGAQTLVGILEHTVFGGLVIPAVDALSPEGFVRDLLSGKYGLVSMGLTYALGIVLPVVATFFLVFGLLEDSGYLPRLAILSDRLMRVMGLNGKATLPMVLGLGCCTMATITTRILNSKKERFIATLLLALGIPCSAQLGVILGISASFSARATLTILGVVASQLLLVGFLASRLSRGRCSEFIFEIPPIRVPQLRNILLKTSYRVRWYLREAVPLFLLGTGLLFSLDRIHIDGASLLEWTQKGLEPVVTGMLHLPPQAASVFVLGFLRRDYGAAGLFDMVRSGLISGQQAVVSLIVITLFVPCVASFLIIVKEQGLKRAVAITGFIVPFAIAVGGTVSWILRTLDVTF